MLRVYRAAVTIDAAPEPDSYELDSVYEAVGRVAAFDTLLEQFLGTLYAVLLESPLAEHVAHGQGFEPTAAGFRHPARGHAA